MLYVQLHGNRNVVRTPLGLSILYGNFIMHDARHFKIYRKLLFMSCWHGRNFNENKF